MSRHDTHSPDVAVDQRLWKVSCRWGATPRTALRAAPRTAEHVPGALSARRVGRRRWSPTIVGVRLLVSLAWLAFVFPLVWMVLMSLKDPAELFRPEAGLLPTQWRWSNFSVVWERIALGRLALNSIVVALVVIAAQLVSSLVAGFVFARVRWRGRTLLWGVYLASLLVPYHLTLIPSFILLVRIGLIDTYGALIVPFLAGALGMLIMYNQFISLPREWEESARLDGCSTIRLLWSILLPLVSPGLKAVATLVFLFNWNNLLWPLLMSHRESVRTLPVGLALLQDELATEWHLVMAAGVLASIPALIILWRLTDGLRSFGPNTSGGPDATTATSHGKHEKG